MSKKDLKSYFEWYQSMIPIRLDELVRVVKQTEGFEEWQPDFSPASLIGLGDWFAEQVETRKRTQEEIQEIDSHLIFPIEIDRDELTNRTFSLAIDIGMYLSKVFLINNPTLKLDQVFGNKRGIDYGQPVITGFDTSPFNPVWMMVTLAYGIASKGKTGARLRELYDIWLQMISIPK
jgi:hypothetical protein